ncbi:hypothetical protein KCV01_g8738, partial [Aureobasidium melanogenum]
MTDEDHAGTVSRALGEQQLEKGVAATAIQRGGRFVRQQQLGATDKRAGRRHALLLADTQLAGPGASDSVAIEIQRLQQSHGFHAQRRRHPTGTMPSRLRPGASHEHVLHRVQERQQVELLEDIADVVGAEPIPGRGPHRRKPLPQQHDIAGRRSQDTGKQAKQGALATTAGTAKEQALAWHDIEIVDHEGNHSPRSWRDVDPHHAALQHLLAAARRRHHVDDDALYRREGLDQTDIERIELRHARATEVIRGVHVRMPAGRGALQGRRRNIRGKESAACRLRRFEPTRGLQRRQRMRERALLHVVARGMLETYRVVTRQSQADL